MRTVWLMRLVAALTLTLATGGCGSGRRGDPIVGELTLSEAARQGQLVFMRQCNQCHPEGAAGLGPSINNKPLPAAAVRLVVRSGFGYMPRFSHQEIDDRQLGDVVAYLKTLRRARPLPSFTQPATARRR